MADAPSSGGSEAVRSVAIHIVSSDVGSVAMATLISPDLAVTSAQLTPGRTYPLVIGTGQHASGQAVDYVPTVALTLLELAPVATSLPVTVLRSGFYPVETMWLGSDLIQTGVLDATSSPWSAQFKHTAPSIEQLRGAPVVMNGRLAGVVVGFIEDQGWAVVPAQEILDEIQQAPPPQAEHLKSAQNSFAGSTGSELLDQVANEGALIRPDSPSALALDQLGPSALRALTHAYASAEGRRIHMGHLVLGLYENAAGSTRRIADAHGITREVLRETIVSENTGQFVGEYDPPKPLAELPSMSEHTAEALTIAARVASENNEPRIRARHLLYGILSVEECTVRARLESLGFHASGVHLKDMPRISGYVSDVAQGVDRLGVRGEALALATVLGAKSVAPPIAVGLLGTWGSGKSFFMHQMERQFARIEQQGRDGDPECCSNIVQIWFNAWHYIDANLWASLTSEIFDALDRELTKRDGGFKVDDPVQERAKLLAESAEAESEREKAAAQKTAAERELAEIAEKRRELRDDRTVASRITLLTIGTAAAGQNEAVKDAKVAAVAAAQELAEKLGIERGTAESLRGVWGRLRAIVIAAKKKKPVEWKVMLALVALSIMIGAFAVSATELLRQILAGSALAGAIGAAGMVVHLMKTYWPLAKDLLGKVEAFITLQNDVLEQARTQALAKLDQQDKAVSEKLASATQREEEETRKIRENEQRLLELKPMQKMKSYVRERRESTDYTKHLGVIAKAHDDFDRLSRHLATVTAKDENGVERPLVDRIVLYIDDLDRCPESKVVDVLQAVHLLLAFPLFVVVVGVDSRWLLHSLKTQMKQFSADAPGDGADALDRTLWESTPINYLEKIFQIPLTLKPMQADGFETLISDLTKTAEARVAEKKETEVEGSKRLADSVTKIIAASEPSGVVLFPEPLKLEIAPPAVPVEGIAPPVSHASHLTFTANEIKYMQALYPLMPSPRGAKRFVNLYRLLRGIIDEYKFQALVNEQNDEHQAVLLLLGMLIGFPEETTDILQELHEKKVQKSAIASPWWTFVSTFIRDKTAATKAEASRERWKALGATLERIRKQVKLPDENRPCTNFIEWAEHVARFSFHSGRIVSDYRAGVDVEIGNVQQVPKEPQLSANA